MRAAARIVAEVAGGHTVLRVLKGEAPLLPRRTGPAEVHFVGGAAGPLGGDELSIELEVGPGAVLVVRTVAASIALPGRCGAESVLSVHATVGEGGRLVWLPEPTVAAARCRHHTRSAVDLAAGAQLVWREEVVLGRHGEESGNIRLTTAIRREGRPLYRSDVALGPDHPQGPAILANARVLATLVNIGITEISDKSEIGTISDLSRKWDGRAAEGKERAAGLQGDGRAAAENGQAASLQGNGQAAVPQGGGRGAGLHGDGRAAIMTLAGGGVVVTAVGDDLTQTRRLTDRMVTPAQ